MSALRGLLWACSLVFAAWATAEAAGNLLETREIQWLLATLVGVGLFGMVMMELVIALRLTEEDDMKAGGTD
jgi:hypothetical protein